MKEGEMHRAFVDISIGLTPERQQMFSSSYLCAAAWFG
jgi:hypothetical protein